MSGADSIPWWSPRSDWGDPDVFQRGAWVSDCWGGRSALRHENGVVMTAGTVAQRGMNRRLAVVVGAALLVLLGLLAPGVARASDRLDQSFTTSTNEDVFRLDVRDTGPPVSLAQTFTAGLTGGLDRIDFLQAGDEGLPNGPLWVEIRNTIPAAPPLVSNFGGQPGARVLARASASIPAFVTGDVEVDFCSPAQVVAGTQYAIVAYTLAANGGTYQFYGSGTYAGGEVWASLAAPPTMSWRNDFDFGPGSAVSLFFQTHVIPTSQGQNTNPGCQGPAR